MSNEGEKPKGVIEEILDKLGLLVTAAFGLVAALAWNEAIQTIFRDLFGTQQANTAHDRICNCCNNNSCNSNFDHSKGSHKGKRKNIKART